LKANALNVTVCELTNDPRRLEESGWPALVAHVRNAASDLVLLPEMPFAPWLAAKLPADPGAWRNAVQSHERWLPRLAELAPAVVVATRPVIRNGGRYNEGFVWDAQSGLRAVHTKYYLPDEEGFREASWYARGDGVFSSAAAGPLLLGFLICTEIWFGARAREYGRQGVDALVCPRATPAASTAKWLAGGRTTAVVSGAFCLSSNFSGTANQPLGWGGTGWIIEPEEGEVLAVTTPEAPFLTRSIDLRVARNAKRTYPRYVPD
jgi:N-carbamoylputrescine amidase